MPGSAPTIINPSPKVQLDPRTLKGENNLLLHFKCAKDIALSEEAKYGRVRAGSCNLGHPSRVYVRKAQYDWRYVCLSLTPDKSLPGVSLGGTG